MKLTGAFFHKRHEFIRRHRPAKQVTLRKVAFQTAQIVHLGVQFNPFGHHLQTEAVGQGDDGCRNGSAVMIALDVGHEGTVDLERIQGKRFR